MNEIVRDFLRQLCLEMKKIHDDLDHAGTDSATMERFFGESTRNKLGTALQDRTRREEILLVVRCALTQIVFNVLVLFDEQRELGDTKVVPRLVLLHSGEEVQVPSYLHELLGDVMPEAGLDVSSWFGL